MLPVTRKKTPSCCFLISHPRGSSKGILNPLWKVKSFNLYHPLSKTRSLLWLLQLGCLTKNQIHEAWKWLLQLLPFAMFFFVCFSQYGSDRRSDWTWQCLTPVHSCFFVSHWNSVKLAGRVLPNVLHTFLRPFKSFQDLMSEVQFWIALHQCICAWSLVNILLRLVKWLFVTVLFRSGDTISIRIRLT